MQAPLLSLRSKRQGALPLLDHFLRQLQFSALMDQHLQHPASTAALDLLVKSVLLQPNALYRIQAWAQNHDPTWLPGQGLNDDALGRALVRLFEADRATLLTALVLQAVKAFELQTHQIHNDSTSVSFAGAYAQQRPEAIQLRTGFSKDHRPDLKQLIYCLSITADGAVPVHFKTYSGNQADDPTHWETWQCLCGIVGHTDFIYVADCKLCNGKVLQQIHAQQGRFITVLPRNRTEAVAFAQAAALAKVHWKPLWRRRACRASSRRETFAVASGTYTLDEQFPLHWYRCSEKQHQDAQQRESRIKKVLQRLQRLNERRGRGPKTEPAMRRAAEKLLAHYRAQDWVEFHIQLRVPPRRRSALPRLIPVLCARRNAAAIAGSRAMDGAFPLVTNTSLSALEVLQKYKYQPHLEKRHFLHKSVLQICPVFLKSNLRVEALMFVYFVAALVASLMERTVRQNMARRSISTIASLPEERRSPTPTYAQLLDAFTYRTKNELWNDNQLVAVLSEPLTEIQKTILELLDLNPAIYN